MTGRELLKAINVSIVDAAEWDSIVGDALRTDDAGQNSNDQDQARVMT